MKDDFESTRRLRWERSTGLATAEDIAALEKFSREYPNCDLPEFTLDQLTNLSS